MGKVGTFIQFNNNEVKVELLEREIKRIWKDEYGNLIKDIEDIRLYIKPEDSTCYYIINDNIKGEIPL